MITIQVETIEELVRILTDITGKSTIPTVEKPEPITTTFDFGDGKGPVPAHQHCNGGGWVADTDVADKTAYVGLDARVYGKARVFGNAQVCGNAWISGNAQIS